MNDVSMQDTYVQLQDEREMLRKLIKSLQQLNRKLADAEQQYREALTKYCLRLKVNGYEGEIDGEYMQTEPVAWTVTQDLARGIPEVAELRMKRDTVQGEVEAVQQKIYQTKIEIRLLEAEMEAIRKGE